MMENVTNLKVKCLQSNNRGEYLDNDFKRYCVENGIKIKKTIPEKPQHNGIAEGMNRTLNERARSMRLHARLEVNLDVVSNLDELIQKFGVLLFFSFPQFFVLDILRIRRRLIPQQKLAIAYGVISSSDGMSPQIVQTNRVCGDCHSAIKLIAMVARREIVQRGDSRFHHFKDGSSSCGDYW